MWDSAFMYYGGYIYAAILSILYVRFLRCRLRLRVFWRLLSILYVRFLLCWVSGRLLHLYLSILYVRFINSNNVATRHRHNFQFSMWDSYPIIATKEFPNVLPFNSLCEILIGAANLGWDGTYSFNSLCEILSWHLSAFLKLSIFQFSMWDSKTFRVKWWLKMGSFNSLCEILVPKNYSLLKCEVCLSILYVRFPKMRPFTS